MASDKTRPYRVGNHSPINIWRETGEGRETNEQIAVAMSPAWATHIVTALNEHHGLAAPNQTAAEPAAVDWSQCLTAPQFDEKYQNTLLNETSQVSVRMGARYLPVVDVESCEDGIGQESVAFVVPDSEPVKHAVANAALSGVDLPAEHVEMLEDVASGAVRSDDAITAVRAALRQAYLEGHDAGFAAANVDDPWADQQPVADSELRDRIAEVARDASGTTEGSQQYAPIHWDDVALKIYNEAVAPVLAERDAEINDARETLLSAIPADVRDAFADAPLSRLVTEAKRLAVYELNLAVATRQQYAEERDAAQAIVLDVARLLGTSVRPNGLDRDVIVKALRGLKQQDERLHNDIAVASTALAAAADRDRWERDPSLLDRVEYVASELHIARKRIEQLTATDGDDPMVPIGPVLAAKMLGAQIRPEWFGVGSQPDSEPRCAEPKGMSICGIELSDDGWCPDHGEVGPPVEATEQAEPWKCGECKVVNSPDAKTCELCLSEAGPVVVVDQPGGET